MNLGSMLVMVEERTLDIRGANSRAEHVEANHVVLMRCLWLPLQQTVPITSDRAVSGRQLSWVCSRQSGCGLLLGKPKYSIRDSRTQMGLPAAVMQRWRCSIQIGRYCVSRGNMHTYFFSVEILLVHQHGSICTVHENGTVRH